MKAILSGSGTPGMKDGQLAMGFLPRPYVKASSE
jgi:hypothetical protein